MIVTNSFNLNMLPSAWTCRITTAELPVEAVAPALLAHRDAGQPIESAIGHADTAAVIMADLRRYMPHFDVELPANPRDVAMEPGQSIMVAECQNGQVKWFVVHLEGAA